MRMFYSLQIALVITVLFFIMPLIAMLTIKQNLLTQRGLHVYEFTVPLTLYAQKKLGTCEKTISVLIKMKNKYHTSAPSLNPKTGERNFDYINQGGDVFKCQNKHGAGNQNLFPLYIYEGNNPFPLRVIPSLVEQTIKEKFLQLNVNLHSLAHKIKRASIPL